MPGPVARRRRAGARRAAGRALVLALLLAPGAGLAGDDGRIFRWEDARGVPHFTDRPEEVPAAYRDQLDLPQEAGPAQEGGPLPAASAPDATQDAAGDVEGLPGWKRFDESAARQALDQVPSSMLVVGAFFLLLCVGLVVAFGAVVLLVACRLVGQESPGFRKAYGIVIVQFLAGLVVGPGVVVVMGTAATPLGALLPAVNLGATLLVNAAVLRAMLCERFVRAFVIAVMVVVVSLALGVVLALGFVTCGLGSAVLRAAG